MTAEPTGSPVVRLVTVSYGSSCLLERNLAAVPPEAGVVVVDNFSGEAERTRIRRLGTERGWLVLTPATNLGFGDGANLGVARAIDDGAEVVLVVNPDVVLGESDVSGLAEAALAHPRALVAPRTCDGTGRITFSGAEVDVAAGRTRKADIGSAEHPWLTGACLAFTPDAWDLAGGFASDYFLYWEDVDLSWVMVSRGGQAPPRAERHGPARRGRDPGTLPGKQQVSDLRLLQLPQPPGLRCPSPLTGRRAAMGARGAGDTPWRSCFEADRGVCCSRPGTSGRR
ncbi:hypothetical protein [Salana multivorans]